MAQGKKKTSASMESTEADLEVGDMEGSPPPPKQSGPRGMRTSAPTDEGGPPVDAGKPARRKPTTGGRRGNSQ